MLPNLYEVEEVARIRREEATQQAMQDRLGRAPEHRDNIRPVTIARDTKFGWIRQRFVLLFKRRERMAAR